MEDYSIILKEHQKKAVKEILEKRHIALFLKPSAGKTLTSLTVLSELIQENPDFRCLIISPLLIAKETWDNEALKWNHTKQLKITKIVGTKEKRERASREISSIYITNVETLESTLKNNPKFDGIIIDESTVVKNGTSKKNRTYNILHEYIKRNTQNLKLRLLLTGTPTLTSIHNIFSQILLIDESKRLGKNLTEFRRTFFTEKISDFGTGKVYSYIPKDDILEKITEKIRDICIFIDVPNNTSSRNVSIINYFDINSVKEYSFFKKNKTISFGEITISPPNITQFNQKREQIASGFIYDENRNGYHIHDYKLDILNKLIEKYKGISNILLAYNFEQDKKNILKRFPYAKHAKELKNIEKEWNSREIPLLIAHTRTISKGLNLQNGGNVIIWYNLPKNPEDYAQLNLRLNRPGQQQSEVYIHHIIAKNSIEEKRMKDNDIRIEIQEDFLQKLTK